MPSLPTSPSAPLHVVWFKRDLRIRDHAALAQAATRGAVLPLYIVEPEVLQAEDFSPRHWSFLRASLLELRENLARIGQPLIVRQGRAVAVLRGLHEQYALAGIWAHEETGNAITYARDRAVHRWAHAAGIPFTEIAQAGVVRALRDRDGWAGIWEKRMQQPITPPPASLPPLDLEPGHIPTHADLGLPADTCATQPGGERAAHAMLASFLDQRGAFYSREMSSPISAATSCSRLSTHLAYGTISTRSVLHATRQRRTALRQQDTAANRDPAIPAWLRSLAAFESRLHWRCHFMQKLETEPEIEHHNFVRAFDGLREVDWNPARFAAWAAGSTGYPMVDACMRALAATGWINFRMRAMLVSFAAYDLWLHWREPSLHLARLFTDYEPGIHYCQVQMQSGTTGINTIRIYNPTKQGQEHDPKGVFIREWLPELAAVPTAFIHTPWLMPPAVQQQVGCIIDTHYPAPIVEHAAAVQRARAALAEVRRMPETRAEARAVHEKHGSRQRPPRRHHSRRTSRRTPAPAQQMALWGDDAPEQTGGVL